MPVRLGTLVAILVASSVIGNDIRVYVFRWRSSLQERLEPLPCPNPDQLAERASLPDVNNDPSIIPSFLTYRCDVNATLSSLFARVTDGATNHLEAGKKWITYVQTTIRSSLNSPLDKDGIAIYHPLWLLEHRAMNCGQNARLVVDGFVAAGIPARVLQMAGHVSAEFFAEGKWRLAEADILGNGEFVKDAAGQPASVDDILARPELLNSVSPYAELTEDVDSVRESFRSIFDHKIYSQSSLTTPYVIMRIQRPLVHHISILWTLNAVLTKEFMRLRSHQHGWNEYGFCSRTDPLCSN